MGVKKVKLCGVFASSIHLFPSEECRSTHWWDSSWLRILCVPAVGIPIEESPAESERPGSGGQRGCWQGIKRTLVHKVEEWGAGHDSERVWIRATRTALAQNGLFHGKEGHCMRGLSAVTGNVRRRDSAVCPGVSDCSLLLAVWAPGILATDILRRTQQF